MLVPVEVLLLAALVTQGKTGVISGWIHVKFETLVWELSSWFASVSFESKY